MEVISEQLFTEVEVNILGFSSTLRRTITLAYYNERISEVRKLQFLYFYAAFVVLVVIVML